MLSGLCVIWQKVFFRHNLSSAYSLERLAKAKAYNTCIAPQAAYCSCSGAVHVTDRAGVLPTDFDQPAIGSPGLSFNDLHVLLIYRPRRDGRMSWPGWLTHSGHFTRGVVTSQHRSGKVCQSETDVLTTEPRRQPPLLSVRDCKSPSPFSSPLLYLTVFILSLVLLAHP